MANNQVIVALQIENTEIRVLAGQFYGDSLFDIIASDSQRFIHANSDAAVNEKNIIEAIKIAINNVSASLKAPIESVLLVIPSINFKKEKKSYDIPLNKQPITNIDVKNIYNLAYRNDVGKNYEIINVVCSNYSVDGITYPKAPVGETGDILSCEVDLFCADKNTTYNYVALVEKAGLKVIDIFSDSYAAASEAALFEQSVNNYVLEIYLEASHTVYSLLHNGRLISCFCDDSGFDCLIKPIMKAYSLKYEDASKILFRYAIIGDADGKDRIISRWNNQGVTRYITYNDLQRVILQASKEMIETIYSYCVNITKYDNSMIMITGKGALLQSFNEVLSKAFQKDVKCYHPDKIGARDTLWTALLGTFYIYRDIQKIYGTCNNSVDMNIYKENLLPEEIKDAEKHSTGKLFNLI